MFVQYAELAILFDQRERKIKYDVIRISWFPLLVPPLLVRLFVSLFLIPQPHNGVICYLLVI